MKQKRKEKIRKLGSHTQTSATKNTRKIPHSQTYTTDTNTRSPPRMARTARDRVDEQTIWKDEEVKNRALNKSQPY